MNSYLGNKARKIKKTSYLWLVVCAIFAASAGSVLIDYKDPEKKHWILFWQY